MYMEQLKDYQIESLCDRFAEELTNWSYEEWKYSSSADKEEIFQAVMDDFDFGMFSEEEIYEVFWYWAYKVDESYFN